MTLTYVRPATSMPSASVRIFQLRAAVGVLLALAAGLALVGCGGGSSPALPDSGAVATVPSPLTSGEANVSPSVPGDSGEAPSTPPAPEAVQPAASVTLPLEVLGNAGTVVSATFHAAQGARATRLSALVNNLSYETMASVQLNNGAWIALRNDTVEVPGAAGAYGGIGGGYSSMTVRVPVHGALDGDNVVRFRFEGTNGVAVGYRVVRFNLLDDQGQELVAASAFTQDDPVHWQAPSSLPQDIAAGEQLWRSAVLRESSLPGARTLQARWMDCHSQDGRDLHRFNYSNLSIVERARFHGLSTEQGRQIASYIRNLTQTLGIPGPLCRPWNPPYQPGSGLDQRPLQDWTCGAGLDAVLEDDMQTLAHVFPEGIKPAAIRTGGQINLREIPIGLQLPDWKRWLPQVHPKDAWGEQFTQSPLSKAYDGTGTAASPSWNLRQRLRDGGTAYAQGATGNLWGELYDFGVQWGEQFRPNGYDGTTPQQQRAKYSTAQWQVLKVWELHQEFGLEAHCPENYRRMGAPKVEPRSWCSHWRFLFDVSPHILALPHEGSIFGPRAAQDYTANAWYYLQVLINPGSGAHVVHLPTDWQYAYGLMTDLRRASGRPEPMRNLLYIVKGTQEMDNGVGVGDVDRGWNFRDASPLDVWHQEALWQGVPVATRNAIVNAYLSTWLDRTESYAPKAWQRIAPAPDGWCGWSERRLCWWDYVPRTTRPGSDTTENFATWSYQDIPRMRAGGVDRYLLNRYAEAMHRLYPQAGFLALRQ